MEELNRNPFRITENQREFNRRKRRETERNKRGRVAHPGAPGLRSTTDEEFLGRNFLPAKISVSLNISEATILFRETAQYFLKINGLYFRLEDFFLRIQAFSSL